MRSNSEEHFTLYASLLSRWVLVPLLPPPLFLNQEWRLVRLAGIQGGYLPLGQLELSSSNVLRASWHGKGGRPDRK